MIFIGGSPAMTRQRYVFAVELIYHIPHICEIQCQHALDRPHFCPFDRL
jgi:hypothetical protein